MKKTRFRRRAKVETGELTLIDSLKFSADDDSFLLGVHEIGEVFQVLFSYHKELGISNPSKNIVDLDSIDKWGVDGKLVFNPDLDVVPAYPEYSPITSMGVAYFNLSHNMVSKKFEIRYLPPEQVSIVKSFGASELIIPVTGKALIVENRRMYDNYGGHYEEIKTPEIKPGSMHVIEGGTAFIYSPEETLYVVMVRNHAQGNCFHGSVTTRPDLIIGPLEELANQGRISADIPQVVIDKVYNNLDENKKTHFIGWLGHLGLKHRPSA